MIRDVTDRDRARGTVPPAPADGRGGPADRRRRPRFQQPAGDHPRQPRIASRAPSRTARDAATMTDDVIGAAARGAELVRRLLAFARMQHLEPELIDFNARLHKRTSACFSGRSAKPSTLEGQDRKETMAGHGRSDPGRRCARQPRHQRARRDARRRDAVHRNCRTSPSTRIMRQATSKSHRGIM